MKKELANVGMAMVMLAALFGMIAPSTAQPEFPYTVFGYVYDTDGVTPAADGVTVTVTNLNTSASLSDTTKYNLGYYATDFAGGFDIGNQIQINATDGACLANITTVTATGSPQLVNLILQADATAPVITDLQPAEGVCVNDSTPEICADYSDASGIDTSSVTITVDGTNVTGDATVTDGGVCYTPSSDLSEGAYTVIVNVSDLCGNPSTMSWTFTVDTIAPTIEFIEPPTPTNNSVITVNYVNISANVTDSGCGIDSVRLIWNGTIWSGPTGGFMMFRVADGQNSFEVTDLPNGDYTYWVEADDIAGNTGMSESRIVTVNVPEMEYNFTLDFVAGYNLISMPLNDTSVANTSALMAEIGADCEEIYKWDPTIPEWVTFNPMMPPQAAFALEGGEGYFVRMSDAASVEISGQGWESPFTVSLVTGYNLIGIPVNDTSVANTSALMTEIGADCEEIYKWDSTIPEWVTFNPMMPPQAAFALEGGEGYFVRMSGTANVTFEGDPWQD